MDADKAVATYNNLLNSHKRLPLDAAQRLLAGDIITLHSGTAEHWSSKLVLQVINNKLTAEMIIHESVPPKMKETLLAKQQQFYQTIAEQQ